MASIDKTVAAMLEGSEIRFADLKKVCDHYFGASRTVGSHVIYQMPWQGQPFVNIQNQGRQGQALPGEAGPCRNSQAEGGVHAMNAEKYTYRVIWSEDDQEHVGLCSEFPGLSHLASTARDALAGIVELVGGLVKQLAKEGADVPAPMSLREYKGKILVRIPPEQHRELDMEAAEQGVSLNRLISRKLSGGPVTVTRVKKKVLPAKKAREAGRAVMQAHRSTLDKLAE